MERSNYHFHKPLSKIFGCVAMFILIEVIYNDELNAKKDTNLFCSVKKIKINMKQKVAHFYPSY